MWLDEPEWHVQDDELAVHAVEGSDLWRHTSHGFVRDTGHDLLSPVAPGQACELEVLANMSEQLDQAGLLVRSSPTLWLRTGLELTDGGLGLSAVRTDGRSDWSTSPVDWLVPFAPSGPLSIGPCACSPSRAGYVARFRDLTVTAADSDLH